MRINSGIGDHGYHAKYYSSRDWRFYRNLLALIAQYSEPGPLLDVGAGCGFLLEGAKLWGLPTEGLEGSGEAIDLANKRCPGLNMRQHLLSDPFPYLAQQFQTVVMNQVIEHLEPVVANQCLNEILRVLKPGGMLLLTSPSKYNLHEKRIDPTHINMYSAAELKAILVEKGYVNIRPLNTPLTMLGHGPVGKTLMGLLFKVTKWDRLSATASYIAYKAST